jgi:hypothetical protein
VPIRVLQGPEYEQFPAAAQEAFWSDEWLVTPNSNRMGYRLAGTELKRTRNTDLLSPEERDPFYPDYASRGASGFGGRKNVSAADRCRNRDA